MDKIELLVNAISPSPIIPGRKALVLAIYYTMQTDLSDGPLLSKDVYPLVARDLNCSVNAVQKRLYRAIHFCWQDGKNTCFHAVVGRTLRRPPTVKSFLMYCSYYIRNRSPFHAAGKEPPPLV